MTLRSKVEISGRWGPYYDRLMDLLFLGTYPRFMAQVISKMQIESGDEILDLGSGTGRNICLVVNKSDSVGRIVGVDISSDKFRGAAHRAALTVHRGV